MVQPSDQSSQALLMDVKSLSFEESSQPDTVQGWVSSVAYIHGGMMDTRLLERLSEGESVRPIGVYSLQEHEYECQAMVPAAWRIMGMEWLGNTLIFTLTLVERQWSGGGGG